MSIGLAPDDGHAAARDLALIDVARRLEAIRHRHRGPVTPAPAPDSAVDEHGVVGLLEAVFDTRGRVRVTGATTTQAWLSLSVDPETDVPHVRPTPAPSMRSTLTGLRALTPEERGVLIEADVAGHMIIAARRALASVAQLSAVAILARLGHGAPVAAATLRRDRLEQTDLAAGPWTVLTTVDPDLRAHLDGSTLRPLTLLR